LKKPFAHATAEQKANRQKPERERLISNILTAPKLHFEQGHCLQSPDVALALICIPKDTFGDSLHAHGTYRVWQGGNRALERVVHSLNLIG
jgi:hypothetical protein